MTRPPDDTRNAGLWLYLCAASVFVMALIGAITRLTESGLSIAEWNPLMGALPPLNEAEWERVFTLYRDTPQYKDVNNGMGLAAFKNIFFWEWFHRLWGRAIGILYAVPFLCFLLRGRLPRPYLPSFLGILALGGFQGFLGWYMVKSGLIDDPAVSHYRLAAHLMTALALYAAMLDLGLRLRVQPAPETVALAPLKKHLHICLLLTLVTMVWGAFVAGLDAGLIYNSFPLMGERPWPGEIFDMMPLWKNFIENHATVQFTHRLLALTTAVVTLSFVCKSRRFHVPIRIRRWFVCLGITVIAQVILGIATLMSSVALPLAVAHQGMAFLLLGIFIRINHELPKNNYKSM